MSSTQPDVSKPFAIQLYEKDGTFGIVCDRRGGIIARVSREQFVLERKEMMDEYRSRSHTWAASATMFGMQFQFKAIMINSHDHLRELVGEGPFTIKGIGGIAGQAYIMCVPRDSFNLLLQDSVDVGL